MFTENFKKEIDGWKPARNGNLCNAAIGIAQIEFGNLQTLSLIHI